MSTVSPPSAFADLAKVRAPGGLGVLASANDELFGVFPRDATASAWDLLDAMEAMRGPHDRLRAIVEEVILTAASLQGVRRASPGPGCNEEEPGKVCHEHRSIFLNFADGEKVTGRRREQFDRLSQRWGGDGRSVTAYTSIDSTPAWIRLVARYCARFGEGILATRVVNRRRESVDILTALRRAISWLETSIDGSDLGLLEFLSHHPDARTKFQSWADSASFIHEPEPGAVRGELANWDAPIAALEVQGLAYDALLGAAELLAARHPGDARRWCDRAGDLQRRTLELFWMADRRFFAMGIDRDPANPVARRLVRPSSSRAGSLLNTRIFDSVDPDPGTNERLREQYLAPVIDHLSDSRYFLTAAGIRCRSLEHGDLAGFADYHGHLVSWAKDTWDAAHGFRRQGLPRMAEQLENRIVAAVNVSGRNTEFQFVLPDGRVLYRVATVRPPTNGDPVECVSAETVPEAEQAWTVTAVLAIKVRRAGHRDTGTADPWATQLDSALVSREPFVPVFMHRAEIAAYGAATGVRGWADLDNGRRLDREMRTTHDERLRSLYQGPRPSD